MAEQGTLADWVEKPKRHLTTPVAHARRTDPQSSHDAAASVAHISELQLEILKAYKQHGPMHDERLVEVITRPAPHGFNIAATPASIRSRRADLVKRLGLVRDSGKDARTCAGRACTIWEAV